MTALSDAARQAALDERDRLDVDVADYIVGRIVQAALRVYDRHEMAVIAEQCIVDCEGWEE